MAKKATDKYKEAQTNEEYYLGTVSNEIEDIEESMHKLTAEELSENPKKYYGKYINYGVDLNGDDDYTNDWKLFYVGGSDESDTVDVKGRIYLIAADYVPMGHDALRGIVAATEGEKSNTGLIRATAEGYGTLSANWSSEPTNFQTPKENKTNISKLFMHEGYDLSKKQTVGNSKCVSTLLNTDNWSTFVNTNNYGEVAIGGPTVEMWCKAWNAVVDDTDEFRKLYANGNKTSGSGYYVGADATQTSTRGYYITNSNTSFSTIEKNTIESKYNVFFTHTEQYKITANGATGNCDGYWIASPSASDTGYLVYVYFGGLVGRGDCYYTGGGGLRPLVCLQSGVKLQKNTAKSDDAKTVYNIVQ